MGADRICVGAVTGAFGVQGEVRLKSFCADPAAIADYGPLWSEDGTRSFTLRLTGQVPQGFSARLSGVAGRDQAQALRGTRLYADRDRLPAPSEDEFYHADLIGLEAIDTGGTSVGRIAAVLNHGASDILEIRGAGLKDALLVPFTLLAVPTVDIAAGRVIIDPPGEAE